MLRRLLRNLTASRPGARRDAERADDFEYWLNEARQRHESGDPAGAQACYQRVLARDPDHVDALHGLGALRGQRGDYRGAIELLRRALSLRPDRVGAHSDLGNVYRLTGQVAEAQRCYQAAAALQPDEPRYLCNVGLALQEQGRLDEALAAFESVLGVHPDFHCARWYRALLLLLQGKFAAGWSDYEARFACGAVPEPAWSYPRWDGSPLRGRTLLVYGEQGLGDELMFASCLPDVLRQDGRILVACNAKLAPLLRRSFPEATVTGQEDRRRTAAAAEHARLDSAEPIDVSIPIGSLAGRYRGERRAFPTHAGYLQAEPRRVEYWRSRLEALGRGVKVGISWRGGTADTRAYLRSIPLRDWLPVLSLGGAQFVSLQYGDCTAEIEALRASDGVRLAHWQDAIDDYDETAALVSALDLTISVQTAVIHLGGALGQPVWVVLPTCPEWRYLAEGDRMPWYPEVRLYRQEIAGDWAPVLDRIRARLAAARAQAPGRVTQDVTF